MNSTVELEEQVGTRGRERRLVFGEVAELYDRYRPGYPAAVFDRIVEFGGLDRGDLVLEVGCGTGRATLPLAERGLRVIALEPSSEMARVAAQKTDGMVAVTVLEAAFEDWPLPREPFRLVASAQAWHWLRPEVRFVRAHQALGAGGSLALIWNTAIQIESSAGLEEAIEEVYRRVAPELAAGVPGEVEGDRRLEIDASGLFVDLAREGFPWSTTYSADDYLGLLQTQSDHLLLDDAVRQRLLGGIAAVLDAHGNQVQQGYCTYLYLARRRDYGARELALDNGGHLA
ncbi:MAG: methyltransferase domain-containing protein [Candidatus Dormiibacterota bacterium]